MAFCGNCGNELREGAKFCPKCGTAANTHQEQQEAKGKRFSTPWIAAFAVLTILIGSYFVTDMVSPETHNKLFGWVSFGESPSSVVNDALTCLKNDDIEGYLHYVYFGDNLSEEEIAGQKALMIALGKEKMKESLKEKGGFKDYKIISESKNGDVAEVEYTLFFGNGEKENRGMKVRKNKKGEWLIDNDKK